MNSSLMFMFVGAPASRRRSPNLQSALVALLDQSLCVCLIPSPPLGDGRGGIYSFPAPALFCRPVPFKVQSSKFKVQGFLGLWYLVFVPANLQFAICNLQFSIPDPP
jgi:hypothetical protein